MLLNEKLHGKSVFITGGTGGIGTPLVDLLTDAGANVTVYNRATDGDLVQNMDELCDALEANTPDILINMAGYNVIDYCEDQDYRAIIDLNLITPMRLAQAVVPAMKQRRTGHIVNVGSMTSLIPLPHLTGYVAAKSGLKGFNDSLRRELAGYEDIHVTLITPRAVRTEMNNGKKDMVNERAGVTYDDPHVIARRIFDAIVKSETDVRIGWPERLFAVLNALCPALIDKGITKHRKIGEQVLQDTKLNQKDKKETKNETKYYGRDVRTGT
jgi:short-subunit dehydrogenase